MLAAAVAIAGCGGGDDEQSGTVSSTVPTVATAPTLTTAPPPPAPTTPTETTPVKPPSTTPEDEPEDGGGSEPARTELEFRGTKAGIKPTKASVAPFISVKVTLTSEDGSAHQLTINGQTAKVGGTRTSAFFTLPGLASGKSYRGVADGSTQVRIMSSSEPGP